MSMRKKLLLALLILLGFSVVLVIADGATQAKEKQVTAYQQDSKNTDVKLNGALKLSSVKKKEEPKKQVSKKAKPKAKVTPAAAETKAADAQTGTYAQQLTKRIAIYEEAAQKAREDGDEDLAQLYDAAAAKERVKREAVLKPEPTKADNEAVKAATEKESAAFAKIVQQTDKDALTAEDKAYLRAQVVTPLQQSVDFFQVFLEQALRPLLQQFLGSPGAVMATASTIHTIATGGCATPSQAVSTGVAVASFVIPLIRSLINLVEYYNQDLQYTIGIINPLIL
jgi:hypothetical protein